MVKRPGRPKAPSQAYKELIGTYHDEAYGDLVIELAATSLDHPELGRNGGPESSFVFRAVIGKVGADELLFSHFDGDAFNVTGKLVFPETGAVLWNVNGQGIEARFGEGGVGFQGIWGARESIDGGHGQVWNQTWGRSVFREEVVAGRVFFGRVVGEARNTSSYSYRLQRWLINMDNRF